jgi:hypothetical protein
MNSYAKRLAGVTVAAVVVCVALGLYIGLYLVNVPGSAAAVATTSGDQLDLATVPAAELSDPHNTWVSYYAVNSSSGDWRHVTTYVLPAHKLVHVTVFEYDSSGGLRNPYFSQPSGTVGPVLVDGKPTSVLNPAGPAHTFAIPQIGLSVPLQGISSTAKHACANAPCSLRNAHFTISFTFRTPAKGLYRWQCFVPCGAGFIDGNGGPMQTVGYMGGFIKVV